MGNATLNVDSERCRGERRVEKGLDIDSLGFMNKDGRRTVEEEGGCMTRGEVPRDEALSGEWLLHTSQKGCPKHHGHKGDPGMTPRIMALMVRRPK